VISTRTIVRMMFSASRALVFVYTSLIIYLVLLLGLIFDTNQQRDIEVFNRNSNADHPSTRQHSTQHQQQQQHRSSLAVPMINASVTTLPREVSLLSNRATKPVAAATTVTLDARSSSAKGTTSKGVEAVRVEMNETYEDWSKRINSKQHTIQVQSICIIYIH